MKRFTLIFTMFLALCSFSAYADEAITVSYDTGTFKDAGSSTSEWNSKDACGLTLTSTDNNGNPCKNIAKISTGLSLEAYISDEVRTTMFTISVPENGNYIITGYQIDFKSYNAVTVTNTESTTEYKSAKVGSLVESELNTKSVSFTVYSTSQYGAIDINEFVVYVKNASQMEARTISAIATEGGSVTINGGSEAVTGTDNVTLVATPDYGYKFVNWTLNGKEVTTELKYTDSTEGDKEYVANFTEFTAQDWYEVNFDKPTFVKAGTTTVVGSIVFDDKEVTDFAYTQGQANIVNGVIEVEAGETYSLTVGYGLQWGDLALYQIYKNGEAEKKYGYYTCAWESYGNPLTVLKEGNKNEEGIREGGNAELMCEELGVDSFDELAPEGSTIGTMPALYLPYKVTIPENQQPGDLVVVRLMVGIKNDAENSASEKNIGEGGSLDILLKVVEPETPGLSHTLTVEETGWATLYLGFNATIPSSVEAYIVKEDGLNDGHISLTQVTGVVPASTGLIIKADAGEYKFNMGEAATADVTGNLLEGVLFNKNVEEKAYILYDGVNGVGLYPAILDQLENTAFACKANKAYLPESALNTELQNSVGFRFDFGGTTAVEKVEMRNEKEEIYDLQGRRINEITQPGIYVVGGVKVLVK